MLRGGENGGIEDGFVNNFPYAPELFCTLSRYRMLLARAVLEFLKEEQNSSLDQSLE